MGEDHWNLKKKLRGENEEMRWRFEMRLMKSCVRRALGSAGGEMKEEDVFIRNLRPVDFFSPKIPTDGQPRES